MTDIKKKARELLSRAETHGTSVVISLDDMRAIEAALQQHEPEYDRELIENMLADYRTFHRSLFTLAAIEKQMLLLEEAINADAAGVHTAKAAPDAVSALVKKWRKQAETHGARTSTGNDHALFANELEAALKGGKA